jgi:hypothetical protein
MMPQQVLRPRSRFDGPYARASGLAGQVVDCQRRREALPGRIEGELSELIDEVLELSLQERREELTAHVSRSVRWCTGQLARAATGTTDGQPIEAIAELAQMALLLQLLQELDARDDGSAA